MSDKREKMKAKIASMMALAKNKAATEGEADNAMRIAMELMKKHSLSLEDIAGHKVDRSDFIFEKRDDDRTKLREIDQYCGMAIARFCDIKMYVDRVDGGVNFFGYGVDVELALYIRDLLIRTSDYEWKRYKAGLSGRTFLDKETGKPIHTSSIRSGWFNGFTGKIVERLDALKGEMVSDTGRDLIVMKSHLVEAAFADEIGHAAKPARDVDKKVYLDPSVAGEMAGEKVQFNRAVHSGAHGGQRRLR
jgi:hypothetical protein